MERRHIVLSAEIPCKDSLNHHMYSLTMKQVNAVEVVTHLLFHVSGVELDCGAKRRFRSLELKFSLAVR
ncbi:hypothetical protein VNO80_03514 [Phaseolus coccineus]|uniref:Uncharacterized protein n=1 Tax=Phaseolus coccineus TaxID=3886 RepID=A0AAN9RRQ3_PHACN